jgi:hypothetical protein
MPAFRAWSEGAQSIWNRSVMELLWFVGAVEYGFRWLRSGAEMSRLAG